MVVDQTVDEMRSRFDPEASFSIDAAGTGRQWWIAALPEILSGRILSAIRQNVQQPVGPRMFLSAKKVWQIVPRAGV